MMQQSASEVGELRQSTEQYARNDCSTYRSCQTGSGYEGFIFSNSAFV